jgi:hypothetical protein
MPKKYVLADDFDGKALPDDTAPIHLSLGRTTYALYLSETNHGKLLKALEPFITDAETVSAAVAARPARRAAASTSNSKEVREWARQNGWPKLGDRGRIPEDAQKAFDAK